MKRILCLIVALFSIPGEAPATKSSSSHVYSHTHADHRAAAGLKLNKGKKWNGDASLRQGMERIRAAFAPVATKLHRGDAPAEGYATLAKETAEATDFIFKNCQLDPEADAVLHVLLSRVLEGSSAMNLGTEKEKLSGAQKVILALVDYPTFFEHKGWKPLPGH